MPLCTLSNEGLLDCARRGLGLLGLRPEAAHVHEADREALARLSAKVWAVERAMRHVGLHERARTAGMVRECLRIMSFRKGTPEAATG